MQTNDLTVDNDNAVRRARRRARKLGLRLYSSRWRRPSLDNYGGFMVVEIQSNFCVAGSRFELELPDIEKFLDERESAV